MERMAYYTESGCHGTARATLSQTLEVRPREYKWNVYDSASDVLVNDRFCGNGCGFCHEDFPPVTIDVVQASNRCARK